VKISIVGPKLFADQLAVALRDRGHNVFAFFHETIWNSSILSSVQMLRRADVIYFLYGSALKNVLLAFVLRVVLRKRLYVHFIGTDALCFQSQSGWSRLGWSLAIKMAHRIFAVTPLLVERLSPHLNVELLPLVFNDLENSFYPYPETFSILVYLPPGRPDFYGRQLVTRLIDDFPDCRFIILGDQDDGMARTNVEQLSIDYSRNMDELYRRTTALLRITLHDGLSNMVMESLARGRQVVWTQSFPYCIEAQRNYDAVCVALEEARAAGPNHEAMRWIQNALSHDRIVDDIERLLENPAAMLPSYRNAFYQSV
jgi:glycosyltransferase involved in cell wall biosynthesis